MNNYAHALIIGEDNELICDIVEESGTAFTVSSATITVYDEDDVQVITKTNSDADFTIDGDQLKYQVNVAGSTFSEGRHTVVWLYTDSTSQAFKEAFNITVKAVP